jgi:hypothetical protein
VYVPGVVIVTVNVLPSCMTTGELGTLAPEGCEVQ